MRLLRKQPSKKSVATFSAETIKSEDVERFKEERNTEALCAGLSSPDLGVRCEAAGALGELKDPTAIDRLVEEMMDSTTHEPGGSPFRPKTDMDRRLSAIWALGDIGDQRAIEPLRAFRSQLAAIRSESSPEVEKLVAERDQFVEPRAGALWGTVRLFSNVDKALLSLGDDRHEEQADEMLIAALLSPAEWAREEAQAYVASHYRGDNPQVDDALELSRSGEEAAMEMFLAQTSRKEAQEWPGGGDFKFSMNMGRREVEDGNAVGAVRAFHTALIAAKPNQILPELHAYLIPVYERLGEIDRLEESRKTVLASDLGLDPTHEDQWRSLVSATPIDDLREAIKD